MSLDYQNRFVKYIRNPIVENRVIGVDLERVSVYTEIVFNNIYETISATFPISIKMLGSKKWKKLIRGFMVDYHCLTPYFKELPYEFIKYLKLNKKRLPLHIIDLMHYEWLELFIYMHEDIIVNKSSSVDFFNEIIVLNPILVLGRYDFAVHKMYSDAPIIKTPTNMIVYRKIDLSVGFIEVNELVSVMIGSLMEGKVTGLELIDLLCVGMGDIQKNQYKGFIGDLFLSLYEQGVILGTVKGNV